MNSLFSNIPPFEHLWQRQDLVLSLIHSSQKMAYRDYRDNILRQMTRDVWQEVLGSFNRIECRDRFFKVENGMVVAGEEVEKEEVLMDLLKKLIPWRKGPWKFGEVAIDAEWRSDIKYSELSPVIPLIKDKLVIDIGGGNGYYGFRLRGDGVGKVINLDPSEKFFFQFELAQKFIQDANIQYEPLGFQDSYRLGIEADAVMSMGVLYHQKDPLAVLESVKTCLKPGGYAIIESMTIPGDGDVCLFPEDRYAKARNVYFLPTKKALCSMCKRAGLVEVEILSDRETSLGEQRSTEWMPYESLSDFLKPNNLSLTIEGYPAPRRTVIVARKKIIKKRYDTSS